MEWRSSQQRAPSAEISNSSVWSRSPGMWCTVVLLLLYTDSFITKETSRATEGGRFGPTKQEGSRGLSLPGALTLTWKGSVDK